ncbi:cytochrome b-c1 complex subunit 8 [Elgaria multicarinata webbii]|uniref:cytochrome b-c1 complex subunit 8 n=1 Tax=Elgaria multicarinata webbii TaxID=159646 RepID=UPI002FCD5159
MGMHFGNLAKMRHMVICTLSPFEQRAFPNSLSKGILNYWRRFSSQFFRVVPPFVVGYLVYSWGNQEFERQKRKNPADYENDV